MEFNAHTDPIAIVLSALKLRQSADLMDRYSEPYVVVVGMDANSGSEPGFHTQVVEFSNVRAWQPLVPAGEGILLYGPANPGAFVALSVAIMESDADVREAGQRLEQRVAQAAQSMQAASLYAASPGAAAARALAERVLHRVAAQMMENRDDMLLTLSGCWLRDRPVPYGINGFSVHHNDFAEATLKVIPLPAG